MDRSPSILSLIIARDFIIDKIRGQGSLIGMISQAHAASFPVQIPMVIVFVEFTDGRGTTPVTLQIVDCDAERDPVMRVDFELESKNPIAILQTAHQFGPIVFPEPGDYRVQLLASGILLKERRILLVPIEPSANPTDSDQV